MVNAITTQFDKTGEIDHRLKADEVRHLPVGDITNAKNPEVSLPNTNGIAWDISAKEGRMTDNNNIITFWRNVVVIRNTPPNILNLKTSKLTFVASLNLAHTDKKVVVIDNSTHIKAIGMKAYLEKNNIQFLSNVRVTHDPAKIN